MTISRIFIFKMGIEKAQPGESCALKVDLVGGLVTTAARTVAWIKFALTDPLSVDLLPFFLACSRLLIIGRVSLTPNSGSH